jgi:hypothetical protein
MGFDLGTIMTMGQGNLFPQFMLGNAMEHHGATQ